MEPCKINSFYDSPVASGISYVVGEAGADFGDYGWV